MGLPKLSAARPCAAKQHRWQNPGHRVYSLLLMAAFAWPSVATAEIYKTIGPDGKITFTDHPPPSAAPAVPATSRAANRAVGKSASTDTASADVDPATRTILLGAAVKVHVLSRVVERIHDICVDDVPESAQSVQRAMNQWQERHSFILDKKDRILKELLPENRHDKLTGAEQDAELQRITQVLEDASPSQKAATCREFPIKVMGSSFSLPRSSHLLQLVADY